MSCYGFSDEVIDIIHYNLLGWKITVPCNELIYSSIHLEEDLQYRDYQCERKYIEDGGEYVQDYSPEHINLIG